MRDPAAACLLSSPHGSLWSPPTLQPHFTLTLPMQVDIMHTAPQPPPQQHQHQQQAARGAAAAGPPQQQQQLDWGQVVHVSALLVEVEGPPEQPPEQQPQAELRFWYQVRQGGGRGNLGRKGWP